MSTGGSTLRWVQYDGVHYAALLVPASEAPVPVPEGSHFVFFLDGESGAVVPETDVTAYDPTDAAKTEHPAAVAGVRIANEILRGAAGTGTTDAPAAPRDDHEEVLLEQLLAQSHDAEVDDDRAAQRAERRRLEKEEKLRRREERAARKALKAQEKKKRSREDDSDDSGQEEDASGTDTSDEDDVPASARQSKKKVAAGAAGDQSHWSAFADMLEDDDGEDEYARAGGVLSRGGDHRRTVTVRGRDRDGLAGGFASLMESGSPVSVYLSEIRHHYEALREEAQERHMTLSATEQAVVAAIDAILQRNAATMQFLERELEQLESAPHKDKAASTPASAQVIRKAREAVEAVVERLSGGPNIEMLVKQLAQTVARPDQAADEAKPRRFAAPGASASTFMDIGFALHLREVASASATPLPMTADLAAKLREQRIYRERIMNYRKGLGKSGLNAPKITPFESWNRTRELMVLAAPVETQLVKPVGYLPRRYSTFAAKREELALRRLSAGMPADAALESLTAGAASTTMPSQGTNTLAHNSFLSSQQDLLSTYMSSTRRARQMVPAFYDFHSLRPSQPGEHAGRAGGVGGTTGAEGAGMAGGLGGGDENHLIFRSTADANLFMSQLEDDTGDVAPLPHDMLPKLAVNFDPHAAFAVGTEEIQEEQARAAQLAGRSQMYSNSAYLPSEESRWFDSVAYATASAAYNGGERGKTSRHRSRASSVSRNNDDDGEASVGGTRPHRAHDWRESAKRVILERLTLYLRGLKGRPTVLDETTFKALAKKLLDRAVLAESRRSGTSLALRVNNDSMEFTKRMAQQLKTSVDKYVTRHFIDHPSAVHHAAPAGEGDAISDTEDDREEENAPVYDN